MQIGMAPSALRGSAWGQASQVPAPQHEPGEDPCQICMVTRLQVATEPCNHQFCFQCVSSLRAVNVGKVGRRGRIPPAASAFGSWMIPHRLNSPGCGRSQVAT